MDATREEIEFLVRSDHRVAVLEELAQNPCDWNDLRTVTGAPSPTMGRILSDFEDRNWLERQGHTYRLTGLGAFVADRLASFLEATWSRRPRRWTHLPRDRRSVADTCSDSSRR